MEDEYKPNKWYYNALTGEIDGYVERDGDTDFSRGVLITYGDYLTTGFDSYGEAADWAKTVSPCVNCLSARFGVPGDKCTSCGRKLDRPRTLPDGVFHVLERSYAPKKGICFEVHFSKWIVKLIATNSGANDHAKLQPLGYTLAEMLTIGRAAVAGNYAGPVGGSLFSVQDNTAVVILPNYPNVVNTL